MNFIFLVQQQKSESKTLMYADIGALPWDKSCVVAHTFDDDRVDYAHLTHQSLASNTAVTVYPDEQHHPGKIFLLCSDIILYSWSKM